jgi:hypothetical protein
MTFRGIDRSASGPAYRGPRYAFASTASGGIGGAFLA